RFYHLILIFLKVLSGRVSFSAFVAPFVLAIELLDGLPLASLLFGRVVPLKHPLHCQFLFCHWEFSTLPVMSLVVHISDKKVNILLFCGFLTCMQIMSCLHTDPTPFLHLEIVLQYFLLMFD